MIPDFGTWLTSRCAEDDEKGVSGYDKDGVQPRKTAGSWVFRFGLSCVVWKAPLHWTTTNSSAYHDEPVMPWITRYDDSVEIKEVLKITRTHAQTHTHTEQLNQCTVLHHRQMLAWR